MRALHWWHLHLCSFLELVVESYRPMAEQMLAAGSNHITKLLHSFGKYITNISSYSIHMRGHNTVLRCSVSVSPSHRLCFNAVSNICSKLAQPPISLKNHSLQLCSFASVSVIFCLHSADRWPCQV